MKKIVTNSPVLLIIGCFLLFLTGAIRIYRSHTSLPCANSVSCINDLTGKISNRTTGVFMGQKVQAPDAAYFALNEKEIAANTVLGSATDSGEAKHIFVDLSTQHLYAFQGNDLIYNFLVSTGRWGPTPTGNFRIWIKLQATRMAGGEEAAAYDLPNVPWTMFFANDQVPRSAGFSLHGAYWHNNFGHPMSHGCVNIRPDQAKLLFDWANPPTNGYTTYPSDTNPGTLITIYGTPPQ